jgi:hypothetical protein
MKKSELKNLIKEAISEVVSEEARMATSDLEAASHYIEHLQELVNNDSELEDWVKSKINIAKENLRTAFEYLSHESHNQTQDTVDETKKKKWIQKALDPKHKGYCTPMTKPTCTPARKALAKRFKKGI